ncbi:FliM/FliN family flagellar motor C-terminal domain-containing protein [Legionella worsleiensis]|uniref:Surface presentation of antigens (SPOA) n=1 Tax=Legionella worsleiensis TaxID=45076 RepID=A0A0W1A614_9GAMM|nr:FliM/FliN family flagellar motor C-terminal domain-containing protein [Legionella worsleiensis]KTD76783.1 Surface presentation of antigens (SPOA) [Legionella worsleiensis]STY30607.1 Flagellar motor switch/type III secretory pathway protein [Legionella worsleiensis]
MIKPYRLINSLELQQLSGQLFNVIQNWNNQYSLNPLSMELYLSPKDYCPSESISIKTPGSTLASLDSDYLNTLNHSLFGKDRLCFNPVSKELFLIFLQELLKVDECSITDEFCPVRDWLYPGSTTLVLQLTCDTRQIHILLHPDWVYQHLPKPHHKKNQSITLAEALSDQQVMLNLELDPITLPLQQLMNLAPGDVIATDQLINTPVSLMRHQQLVARADLGTSITYKSIMLRGIS